MELILLIPTRNNFHCYLIVRTRISFHLKHGYTDEFLSKQKKSKGS